MKVYLSSQYPRLADMRSRAMDLHAIGARTVSSWHDLPDVPDGALTAPDRERMAHMDLDDLERADLMVCFGDEPGAYRGSGGKFVELGYAIGVGVSIVWVGPREGVFPYHRDVTHCETWEQALHLIAGRFRQEAA